MNKIRILNGWVCLLAIVILGNSSISRAQDGKYTEDVTQAVVYLLQQQLDTGLFAYDFDLKKKKATGKNSLVRQAGTLFSLAEFYQVYPTTEVEQALINGLTALDAYSTVFTQGSKQLVSGGVEKTKIRTGATALALLTELIYFRASGNGDFESSRKKWLKGLLSLQINNQGFATTPKKEKESPYFNGETWLALAHYVDIFDDAGMRKRVEQLDNYLIKKYSKEPHVGFYHWGVMAALIRYEATQDKKFIDFIENQSKAFLNVLRPKFNPNSNSCYSLEGLIPAYKTLLNYKRGTQILTRLKLRIEKEISKNLDLQIDNIQTYNGAFLSNRNKNYTRIDYTQHCLSALLK